MPTLPLAGLTVLDLSRALAGPYCTAILADLGATIIKVESLNGDPSRAWPPSEGMHSLYFDAVNRGKQSLCLDVYGEAGMGILHRLIRTSDVLVENFKFGTLARMGLSEDRIRELHPEIIVASITGFGDRGPLRDAAGLDQVVQGMSGIMSVTGEHENNYRVGVPIIDITSGMSAAIGVLSGLVARSRDVEVRGVSTSLLETGLALGVFQAQSALSLGVAPGAQGNAHPSIAPYGSFTTATGAITIATGTDKHWRALCDEIGEAQLVDDPRFLAAGDRLANRAELTRLIEARLASDSAESWLVRLRAVGIPCGPIYDYVEAFGTEQARALGMVQQVERNDGGPLPLVRGPISIDGVPPTVAVPPELGEHSREILLAAGYAESEIEAFERQGVVLSAGQRERS